MSREQRKSSVNQVIITTDILEKSGKDDPMSGHQWFHSPSPRPYNPLQTRTFFVK